VIWCDVRVFPAAGRLLAALVLAGVALVVGPVPAHACCVAATGPRDIRAASDVFTGTVTGVRSTGSARRGTVTYAVAVERVYRGGVRTDHVTVTTRRARSTCGVDRLRAQRRYVFLAKASGSDLVLEACGGTAAARPALVRQVEQVLGKGRAPSPVAPPSPPATATFTPVSASRPAGVTRLAAPGAALVLAGLLGLVVVRRLARRT
jgi:hypothetical protein